MVKRIDAIGRLRILIIDDSLDFLEMLVMLLEPLYDVTVAESGKQGVALACSRMFDLILLDIYMPEMDGFTVCERLKRYPRTRYVPVILMSGRIDTEGESRVLEVGAADFICKPVRLSEINSRIQSFMVRHAAMEKAVCHEAKLDEALRQRSSAHEKVIEHEALRALVRLISIRDIETCGHLLRTQTYVEILARRLSSQSRFAQALTPAVVELIVLSAPLHDIGKVGIPKSILRKQGPLTAEERVLLRTHPQLGLRALQSVEYTHEDTPDFLQYAKEIVIGHHEKWDGSGYPYGLMGDDIPLAARLVAVADAYDVLVSRHTCAVSRSHEDAVQEILDGSGTHFDPEVVQAFKACSGEFADTSMKYQDDEAILHH